MALVQQMLVLFLFLNPSVVVQMMVEKEFYWGKAQKWAEFCSANVVQKVKRKAASN